MIKFVYSLIGLFVASANFASESELAEIPDDGGPASSSGNVEEKPSLPKQSAIKSAIQAPGSPQKKSYDVTYIGPKPKIFENQ